MFRRSILILSIFSLVGSASAFADEEGRSKQVQEAKHEAAFEDRSKHGAMHGGLPIMDSDEAMISISKPIYGSRLRELSKPCEEPPCTALERYKQFCEEPPCTASVVAQVDKCREAGIRFDLSVAACWDEFCHSKDSGRSRFCKSWRSMKRENGAVQIFQKDRSALSEIQQQNGRDVSLKGAAISGSHTREQDLEQRRRLNPARAADEYRANPEGDGLNFGGNRVDR